MNRRGFLFGAPALLAAPAIVRVASIMPVSVRAASFRPVRFVNGWTVFESAAPWFNLSQLDMGLIARHLAVSLDARQMLIGGARP